MLPKVLTPGFTVYPALGIGKEASARNQGKQGRLLLSFVRVTVR